MNKKYIKIWRFIEAPIEYQNLSENGGDEDWIAFLPDTFNEDIPLFLEKGSAFGCFSVDEYLVDNGKILIGCHA